jgi:hypothetical protein
LSVSTDGPKYRTVTHGLNLTGICKNEICIAFNEEVVIQKGMGIFDISYE